MNPLRLAWRSLRREFRYGELATLAAALVLAVAALAAVATLGARVQSSILASAGELIGGDIGVSAHAQLSPALAGQAAQQGMHTSLSVDFPSVLFVNGKSHLADVRAADPAYPLRGELKIRDAQGNESSVHTPTPGSVYAEHRLLVALDLKPGDNVPVGNITLRVAGEIEQEPDGGQLFALSPRLLMNLVDARRSGLLASGSRAHYRLMATGNESQVAAYGAYLKSHMPTGGRLITVQQSRERLRDTFDRGESFLRLAALLAALLSGIAVAMAAQRYARRKTDEIALLRCLGASSGEVLSAVALTLLLLAVPACVVGALLGLGLQQFVFAFARSLLPGAAVSVPLMPALAAFLVGLAVLVGFALPPLLRLREVPPIRVFQRAVGPRVRRFDGLYLLPFAVAGVLIYLQSDSPKLAWVLGASLGGVAVFALVLGLASIRWITQGLRRLPGALRFGIANLARRRSLSLLQIIALALAATALDLLAVVGPSLLGAWRADLPPDTPNYFLINLQPDQTDAVMTRLKEMRAQNLSVMPLAVGKLIAINGKKLDPKDFKDRRAADWINGETRLSWSGTLPPTNHLRVGRWFDANPKRPEFSIDMAWVHMFDLGIGDTMTLRIGDRDVTGRITSLRGVRWDSFRVNFFLLMDPASARGLAYSNIASFHLPRTATNDLASLSKTYPNLSLIDINDLLDRVRDIIGRVSQAVTSVLGFSLAAGLLVLIAALAASADERRFEAALLRTLGADRRQLTLAVLGEFAVLGALAGVIAALGAGLAGMWLARSIFRVPFVPPIGELALCAIGATLIVALAGWLGTRRIARTSPLLVLRRA